MSAARRLASQAALVLLLAAGCGSAAGPAASRLAYLEAHPEIDPEVRELVRVGRVREGMTTEQVQAALGRPDSRRQFAAESHQVEVWAYPGVLVSRRITRSATDLDYRVRLIFRDGVLERIEDQ